MGNADVAEGAHYGKRRLRQEDFNGFLDLGFSVARSYKRTVVEKPETIA